MIHKYSILSAEQIRRIHDSTVQVLSTVGVRVYHDTILDRLAEAGAEIERTTRTARIGEELLTKSLGQAGKSYTLYGRDGTRAVRYGFGELATISSPGQYGWVDLKRKTRRSPTSEDTYQAIAVGDALEHIDIVGALTQPVDIPTPIRDIWLTAELVKRTRKPTRCWIANGDTARYILEIYKTVAGGEAELRAKPQIEAFIEPISPLQMPTTGMEILIEFTRLGLPVSYGPMVMATATGPATLAGTLVQENAETLAAIVITQVLRPGTPVLYGGIPHVMDPKTTSISFGSPEQGIMAVCMAQVAGFYGLPVYVNTGMTDSCLGDAQAGMEKGMTFLLGALAGGDLLMHAGFVGADQGASLAQLVLDNEMVAYVKRILRGLTVDDDTLAVPVIESAAPQGDYMTSDHTLRHFRQELWLPGGLWNRADWDTCLAAGGKSMVDRAAERAEDILASHQPEPIAEELAKEIDAIVESAKKHLLG